MIYNFIFKIKANLNIDNIVRILAILFICFIEFRIFHQQSLSLADPIFILLIFSIIARGKINYSRLMKDNSRLVALFLVFAAIWFMSFIFPVLTYHSLKDFFDSNFFMIIGSLYLVAISFTFFHLTLEFGWLFIIKTILYSGLLNAILGITGLVMFMIGLDSNLVSTINTSSPYLEEFPRLTGFALTPNGFAYSLFTSLLISIPLYFSESISKKFIIISSTIIFIALIFTFAKILLIFLLTVATWYVSTLLRSLKLEKVRKYILTITLLSGLFLYILVTHILFIDRENESECVFGDRIQFINLNYDNIHFCPSLFLQKKIQYSQIGLSKLPWGAGAKNDLILSQPHSTYLERFALHGVLGVLSLFILIYNVSHSLNKIKQSKLSFNNIYFIFYLFWLMNLYIAINADILRYRELWVMIGLTLGIAANYSKKTSIVKSTQIFTTKKYS